MDSKNIGKVIRKNAKKVIAASGMGSSRSGNKELSHLIAGLSHHPINSLESAQVLGARLGEKIVELSKASNKTLLDKGVIRTLVVTKVVPSVADLPIVTAPVNVPESTTRQASKVSKPVASSPSVEHVQPTVLPADEPDSEDETSTTEAEFSEDITSEALSTQVVEGTKVEEDEDEEDEEDEAAAELLEEMTEAIQAEDEVAAIASAAVDDSVMAAEPDAEEPATEIVSAP